VENVNRENGTLGINIRAAAPTGNTPQDVTYLNQ
jgi:hypothetical protein